MTLEIMLYWMNKKSYMTMEMNNVIPLIALGISLATHQSSSYFDPLIDLGFLVTIICQFPVN